MLASSVLRPNTEVWRQQWETRLPDQIVATFVLTVGVLVVSVGLGVGLAWLVSAHQFPGRRVLSWALVLPLAMPSYILGFVATAVFGVAGPIQVWWREQFGRDAWFPEVRSMPGAIVALSLTLYPYVYLLARAALRDQASAAYVVARTLGATRAEATRRVVLPMLRPAIAAGAAIVAMETLTDFATVQYFNVETVTVGVFRIWRGTYDRDAASEIATVVLLFAVVAIGLERVLRGRARFGESGGPGGWRRAGAAARLAGLGGDIVAAGSSQWPSSRQRRGCSRGRSTSNAARGARPCWPATWSSSATASCSPASPSPSASLASLIVGNARRFSQSPVVGVSTG